jgi:hypothetical protein
MKLIIWLLLASSMLVASAISQPTIPQVKIQFAKGTSSKTIQGSIKGDQSTDYVVRAGAGQTMKVTLATKNTSAYFNLISPGEENTAIFIGSTSGNEYEGTLPSSGDYKISVYLMRAAARRGTAATFTLTIAIGGKTQASGGKASTGESEGSDMDRQAATIERTAASKFDATGEIPCAQQKAQPMRQCHFGVARAGGGTATVVITMPDGRQRTIYFVKGKPGGSDASQAEGGGVITSTKDDDLYKITSGNERYEIPEAVVYGG